MSALVALVCGVFGLMVGSFLNVVIWRVPRHESIVRPPSHCPACDHQLSPLDNIPLVSWVLLRGRCRYCRARVSARYPAVELLTACLWAALGARFADDLWSLPAYLVLSASLVALSLIDFDHKLLPNAIVYPTGFLVAGLLAVAAAANGAWGSLGRAGAGAAIYFASYFVLWFVVGGRALGFGDVRLAAVLGLALAWLGWSQLAWGMFTPFLIGSILGMLVVAPWLAVPMLAGAVIGAVLGVDVMENLASGSIDDETRARVTSGVLGAVLLGAGAFVFASATGRVPRGRALPFGPAMATGCLAVVLVAGPTLG